MRNHNQRLPILICTNCKEGACEVCVDVPRKKAGFTEPLCACPKKDHREKVDAA